MTNRKNNGKVKLNNKGSALVVVIIVIAFITILATLILYLSVMNFQMKGNDYRTKVSFYGAEVPLEELRVQLAIDMSEACEVAYANVMAQYDILIDSSGSTRMNAYSTAIFNELGSIWNARNAVPTGGTDWVEGIKKALNDTASDEYHVISGASSVMTCSDPDCGCAYHIIVMDMPSGTRLEFNDAEKKAILHDIKVVYTENSFTSVITTDFCFYIPEFDWSVESYANTWTDGVSTINRTKIDYEKCVVYLNWSKQ